MTHRPNHCNPQDFDACTEIFNDLPMVFYRLSPSGCGHFYSTQAPALLGYSAAELVARPGLWRESIHAEDRPAVERAIAEVVSGAKSFNLQYRFRHQAGHWIWLHDRCVRRTGNGETLFIEGVATDVTARWQAEAALANSHQRIEHVLDSLDAGVLLYSHRDQCFSDCNSAAAGMFGYGVSEIKGMSPAALHPDDVAYVAFRTMAREALRDGGRYAVESPLRRADGTLFPASIRVRRLQEEADKRLSVVVVNDLTQQHAYEEQLSLARQVFDNAAEAVMISDAKNRIISVNAAFTRITGWKADEVVGRDPSFLSSGKQGPEFYRDMWRVLEEAGVWQGEIVNRRRSGQYYPEWLSISTVRNRQGKITHFLAIFSDISERKRAEGLIHRYSWFDSLTDLPNKALLIDRINQALLTARNEGRPLYIMAINLNRLKHINDSFGHRSGDEVLKLVAQRLVAGTREGDTVSRVTGDDFVVVVPRLSQPHRAMNLAERLLESINESIDIEGSAVHVTANAGLVAFPSDGGEPDALLQNADAALNYSRNLGPGQVTFFEPRMNSDIVQRMSLQSELAIALTEKQFELHFQPQVRLGDNQPVGVEALIRWQHPERGIVSPAVFIPTAEEIGLIIEIGEWVLNEACRRLAEWHQCSHPGLMMAVNLSAHQFTHPNLVHSVRAALQRHGVPPSTLELEITESVAMSDVSEVLARLQELKKIGVMVSIDDFGTGYSSLAYLRRFPVDKLKIDQSFVRDMTESAEATSIVRAVVALGHGLGLNVIAEGVETPEQQAALKELGCDEIQGYLLSRPIAFPAMTEWLATIQERTA